MGNCCNINILNEMYILGLGYILVMDSNIYSYEMFTKLFDCGIIANDVRYIIVQLVTMSEMQWFMRNYTYQDVFGLVVKRI